MAFAASEPVESGQSYAVTVVNGQTPSTLTDFFGDTSITVAKDGATLVLCGSGAGIRGAVSFQQKHPDHGGKDVRMWLITDRGDGTFHAVPVAAF